MKTHAIRSFAVKGPLTQHTRGMYHLEQWQCTWTSTAVKCCCSFNATTMHFSTAHVSASHHTNTTHTREKCWTYNFVWPVDFLQLFSNVSRPIWAPIIYDYNFIVDSTRTERVYSYSDGIITFKTLTFKLLTLRPLVAIERSMSSEIKQLYSICKC